MDSDIPVNENSDALSKANKPESFVDLVHKNASWEPIRMALDDGDDMLRVWHISALVNDRLKKGDERSSLRRSGTFNVLRERRARMTTNAKAPSKKIS